jgi:uncharacterized membrane protein YqjE
VDVDRTDASSGPPPGTSGGDGPGRVAARPNGARLPDVLRSISSDLSLLLRKQIELAKQEVASMAASKARGAAMLAAAAVLALFVLGFLGLAGAAALDLVLPRWAADLIVGAVFLLLAAVAALAGRSALTAESAAPERTKETLKEDVEWAKQQLRR